MRDVSSTEKTQTIHQLEEESFLIRSFVWVFRSPDGRHTQTDLETAHEGGWWDVALGFIVAGRVLYRMNKWLQRT